MKMIFLDTTFRSRLNQYFQQNNSIPDLYFIVKFNDITYFQGRQSNKQVYGTTAKYSFIVPRAFANYPVSTVEVYEINSNNVLSLSPSILLNYDDEYIYDGIDQIIEFEIMLDDSGSYTSSIDMFILTHIVQSLYFSDDIVSKMLQNNNANLTSLYMRIEDCIVTKPGNFLYENGLMIRGYFKDYAYIYNYLTGEIYIV